MNLLSSVQEQLCRLSMKHASKELEGILENAQHHDWTTKTMLQPPRQLLTKSYLCLKVQIIQS
jgi:hypothetical protein